MIPFRLWPQPGVPIHEQLVRAAKKAIIAGIFRPGDPFPSVRSLAAGFHMHVNTAQRAIAALEKDGMLEVRPGIGTVVANRSRPSKTERARLLRPALEPLLVEALRIGMPLDEFHELISAEWNRIAPARTQEV